MKKVSSIFAIALMAIFAITGCEKHTGDEANSFRMNITFTGSNDSGNLKSLVSFTTKTLKKKGIPDVSNWENRVDAVGVNGKHIVAMFEAIDQVKSMMTSLKLAPGEYISVSSDFGIDEFDWFEVYGMEDEIPNSNVTFATGSEGSYSKVSSVTLTPESPQLPLTPVFVNGDSYTAATGYRLSPYFSVGRQVVCNSYYDGSVTLMAKSCGAPKMQVDVIDPDGSVVGRSIVPCTVEGNYVTLNGSPTPVYHVGLYRSEDGRCNIVMSLKEGVDFDRIPKDEKELSLIGVDIKEVNTFTVVEECNNNYDFFLSSTNTRIAECHRFESCKEEMLGCRALVCLLPGDQVFVYCFLPNRLKVVYRGPYTEYSHYIWQLIS